MAAGLKGTCVVDSTKVCRRRCDRTTAVVIVFLLYSVILHKFYAWIYFPYIAEFKRHVLKCEGTSHQQKDNVTTAPKMRLLMIGGHPKSGTTLLRAMIGSHPSVLCQPETRILPTILQVLEKYRSPAELHRLDAAGFTSGTIDSAARRFIDSLIAKGPKEESLSCLKDPLALLHMKYLSTLYKKVKFLYIVRDGRAVSDSLKRASRNLIDGVNVAASLANNIKLWNSINSKLLFQCRQLQHNCLLVYYEGLVLHPKLWMEKITQFLNLEWSDDVLHHEKYADSERGVKFSRFEPSSYKAMKPIKRDYLLKWKEALDGNLAHKLFDAAPMLSVFGYSLTATDYDKFLPQGNRSI